MVNKFRGTSGTTVFITAEGHRRLVARSKERPARAGRGADRRVGDELLDLMASYEARASLLAPNERLCTAASLLNYPGRLVSGKLREEGRRPGEVLQDGSCRLYVRPDLRTVLERIMPYGLVLDHQVVTTRPAGTAVHARDIPDGRGEKGRPLSDAVNTAVILATGPLPDGPLAELERQTLKQATAQQLWDIAVRQLTTVHLAEGERLWLTRPFLRSVRDILRQALPKLLRDNDEWMKELEQVLPNWTGTLEAITQELSTFVSGNNKTAVGERQG